MGWADKYPHKSDAGDEYYFVRRKDRNDVVVMGFSMGKAWLNGVSYDPSEMRSHLFLGPLRPQDFEQLARLREALQEIADRDTLCNCEHNTEFCCAKVGHYCAFCIAATALDTELAQRKGK